MFLSETALPKWTDIWWEAPMDGSVLNFLKAEWKVSDTDSAHWASSLILFGKEDKIQKFHIFGRHFQHLSNYCLIKLN
jgi:hypothetical protein